MPDPYLYTGTTVLKNNFDVKNQKELDDIEANYTVLRLRELAQNPLPGKYNLHHFLSIHHYIFQDIFDWAGKIRKINIEKEEPSLGGLSIEYSPVTSIAHDLEYALRLFKRKDWPQLDKTKQATLFCQAIAALWQVHAFREGNTRATVTFCCQYADEKINHINRKLFEDNSAFVRTALVAYNAVFHDLGDLSQKQHLERIVADALS